MIKFFLKFFLFINKVKCNFFYIFINFKIYFLYINNFFKYNLEILKYVYYNYINKVILILLVFIWNK